MPELIAILQEHMVIVTAGVCMIIMMVLRSINRLVATVSRERSRRELAAYVAEGTIPPEMAERLIRADVNRGTRG